MQIPVWSAEPTPSPTSLILETQPPENLEITVRTEGPFPEIVHAEEPFEWRIVIRWYGEAEAIIPQLKKVPTFEGLQILTSSTTLKTGVEKDRRFIEKIFTYQLMGERAGEFTLDSAAIEYRGEAAGKEPILTTDSKTITLLPELFSIKKFVERLLQQTWFRWVVSILLIGSVVCVTLIRRNRFRKQITAMESIPVKKPSEEAFESAYRSRVEGNFKSFIRILEKAVRLSLAERFPGDVFPGLAEYRNRIAEEQLPIFERFVHTCEESKYAPIDPSAELLNRLWDDAHTLAGSTWEKEKSTQ